MIRYRAMTPAWLVVWEQVHQQELLEGEKAMKDQLEALVREMHTSGILYSEAVREFKKRFIENVLRQNKGNQCKAARELGMHRNTLSRAIAELDLDVREYREPARRPVRAAVVRQAAMAAQA